MNINMNGKGRVTIDGRDFQGKSIRIVGNKVLVDGKEQPGTLVGPIQINVQGDVSELNSTGDVRVIGSCRKVTTVSGDIHCANVLGDVETVSGDIFCGKVAGTVKTVSGDIVGSAK